MNFVAAILILFLAYLLFATRVTQGQYRINDVRPGSAADVIGFQAGDTVLGSATITHTP